MKRALGLVIALALTAAPAVGADASRPRRVQLPYTMTDDNTYVVGGPVLVGQGSSEANYRFPIRKGERWVNATIVDDSERPVGGVIRQYVTVYKSPDGAATVESRRAVTSIEFCGRTDEPQRIKRKLTVYILVFEGACADGTPSIPTNGEIVLDFYRDRSGRVGSARRRN